MLWIKMFHRKRTVFLDIVVPWMSGIEVLRRILTRLNQALGNLRTGRS